MSTEHALYSILLEQIETDTLLLPTLPEVAIRVRETVDDPDANINQICAAINQDPALSLRLVRLANTSHYARAAKVSTLSAAVHRIGLRAIKNISIAMALEQLFICQNPIVKSYMAKQWRQSVSVCCVSASLFALYQGKDKPKLTQDAVALMGLVHNIGTLPILSEAERHDDVFANPTFLDKVIAALSCRIGEKIISSWEFEEDFQRTVANWCDVSYEPKGVDYIDFVRLGTLHAKVPYLFKDPQAAMAGYVEKGVISSPDIFEDDTFRTYVEEAKAAFE